jgi:hypothetical protein
MTTLAKRLSFRLLEDWLGRQDSNLRMPVPKADLPPNGRYPTHPITAEICGFLTVAECRARAKQNPSEILAVFLTVLARRCWHFTVERTHLTADIGRKRTVGVQAVANHFLPIDRG